jgi:hypothetical protein
MESKLSLWEISVRVYSDWYCQALSRPLLQNCFTIVVTTKNFFLSHKRFQPPESCDRRRRSTLCSKTLRSSMRATWASTSSCGSFLLLFLGPAFSSRLHARYFIRVTISRRMADVVKERDIWVHSFRMPPDSNNSIKMEVGIEDCLHIEFEYNKSK